MLRTKLFTIFKITRVEIRFKYEDLTILHKV